MGDYRVSKESLHEDEAMLETDSLVLGSDLGKGWNPVSSQPTTTHRAVNYLLTAALLCSIIVVWLYGATKNGACDAGLNQYYYYSPALEATKPGSRITHLNWTNWSPFSPNNGDSLQHVDGNWTALLRDWRVAGFRPSAPRKRRRLPRIPHYLHCLYVLHQSLNQEYYSTRSVLWNMRAERRASHWNHCVESLRQYVVCHADATVVTHYWAECIDGPAPEQGNWRRCADWDAQFRWRLER
ncbi:hypothetical protein F4821DRAFT_281609 [Hypoxylon rubiginosum]|uniref:Uncharacterized protein n=1 Tax=Hypoxylon rubiginosum TaxID=110542 RepID=A0ACC0DE71_9PEZI|nr:hypothetical protein F4821DRAFT_281609 [Hypoxylon rubiginosum]